MTLNRRYDAAVRELERLRRQLPLDVEAGLLSQAEARRKIADAEAGCRTLLNRLQPALKLGGRKR